LITQEKTTIDLGTPACPTSLHPNADETGYYRWTIPKADLMALAARGERNMSKAERAAFPLHLAALLESGALGEWCFSAFGRKNTPHESCPALGDPIQPSETWCVLRSLARNRGVSSGSKGTDATCGAILIWSRRETSFTPCAA
jgi:hypothetical protein